MKCFVLVILLIVILKTEFVKSNYYDDPYDTKGRMQTNEFEPYCPKCKPVECICPKHNVAHIVMGVTIGVLLCIIIGLLVFIYKLKHKVYCDSVEDRIEINKNESTQKYVKQVSSEPAIVVSYTRENSNGNDEGRFKIQRQDSKLTVVEYPNSLNTNEKKSEEPTSSTVTLSKIMQQHPVPISRDRMKELCKGVLLKSQQFNASTTSLSNLEKMKEESKDEGLESYAVVDKSASTGLLDVVENSKPLPSPKPVNKLKAFPEYTQKAIKLPVFTPKVIKKAPDAVEEDDIYDNPPPNNRRLAKLVKKAPDAVEEDDIYDNPPPNNRRLAELVACDDEHSDDVYDNPPNLNRPVSNFKDEDMDEVYDNPPNRNRPVSDYGDDVYDNVPNNRPLFNDSSDNVHLDDIYDNPQSNEPIFVTSNQRLLKAGQVNEDEYVLPQKKGRGILVPDSTDNTGYVSPLTSDKETCFNSDYSNAKSLYQKNPF